MYHRELLIDQENYCANRKSNFQSIEQKRILDKIVQREQSA